jgi:hypothetical protein
MIAYRASVLRLSTRYETLNKEASRRTLQCTEFCCYLLTVNELCWSFDALATVHCYNVRTTCTVCTTNTVEQRCDVLCVSSGYLLQCTQRYVMSICMRRPFVLLMYTSYERTTSAIFRSLCLLDPSIQYVQRSLCLHGKSRCLLVLLPLSVHSVNYNSLHVVSAYQQQSTIHLACISIHE